MRRATSLRNRESQLARKGMGRHTLLLCCQLALLGGLGFLQPLNAGGAGDPCLTSQDCMDAPSLICMFSTNCVQVIDGCPTGWTSDLSGGSCVKWFNLGMTYSQAKAHCPNTLVWSGWPSFTNVGHLAKITSLSSNNVVQSLLGLTNPGHIGLDDVDNDGVYSWYDGTPVFRGNRGPGYAEPGVYNRFAITDPFRPGWAVYLDGTDGNWYNWNPAATGRHVCQINQVCEVDEHCPASMVCSYQNRCVECRLNGDCASNEICIDNACIMVTDGCPSGWTSDGSGGSCVRRFDLAMDYTQAKAYCPNTYTWSSRWPKGTNAAHLAKITSLSSNNVVKSLLGTLEMSHIGLDTLDTPNVFSWYDGTPVFRGLRAGGYAEPGVYNRFAITQPSTIDWVAYMDEYDGYWYLRPSASLGVHVCQINQVCVVDTHCPASMHCSDNRCVECLNSGHCASNQICIDNACIMVTDGCPSGWTSDGSGGSCVQRFALGMDYTQAKAYCPDTYTWSSRWPDDTNVAHLVKIPSQSVNNLVQSLCAVAPGSICYIGLDDIDTPGVYSWYDGTPVFYGDISDGHKEPGVYENLDSLSPGFQALVGFMDGSDDYWYFNAPGSPGSHVCQINQVCVVDTHCPASMHCSDNRCMECLNSGHCASNQICIDNACITVTNGCPPGWTSDLKGGSCIKRVLDYEMVYTEAKAYCPGTFYWSSRWPNNTNVAHLVKIPNADVNAIVFRSICNDYNCPIGLDDIDTPGVYSWYDGTPVYHGVNGAGGYPEPGVYNHFEAGEPSGSNLNFFIDTRSDFWTALDAEDPNFALCQIDQVCEVDVHCPVDMICSPANRCVDCLLDSDCPGDKVCVSNTCKAIPCDNTDDCPESVQLCIRNECISVIDGCPLGWLPDTGSGCVKGSGETSTFDDSELACNTTEWPFHYPGGNIGHLAKITSAAMNDAVLAVIRNYPPFAAWIGLVRVTNDLYVWRDNEVATYQNWDDSPGTGCVMMYQEDGLWNPTNCFFSSAGRVCQIKQFCGKDANCPSATPLCNPVKLKCVECVNDGHCSGGKICINDTCVVCKDEYCSGGKVCSRLSGCVECAIGDNDTFRGCSSDDEPFCLPLQTYVPDLPASQNDTGVCMGCLDTGARLDTDTGCSVDSPLCVATHEFVIGEGGVVTPVVAYSMCYACQDTETGSTQDFGCSPTQPYCVFGRDETGFGHGCSEYPNPACFFSSDDITPDADITCPTDVALEARIELALENCTATSMNLNSIAISMASAMNISTCSLELSLVRNEAHKDRHLLGSPSNFTLLLLVFVADEAQGSAILNSTIELALTLALLEDYVGEVVAISVSAAIVRLSTVTSDPHFVTSDGSKFDFNGVAGQTYCIVTDARLQVNARFVGTAESSLAVNAPSGRPDTRTWMDQVAILYGSDQVLVEAASPPGTPFAASFGTIRVNGEFLLGRTSMKKLVSGLTVARTKTRVAITVPDTGAIEVEVVRAAFWQPGAGPNRNFLNLQFKGVIGLRRAHGVLGQSLGSRNGLQFEGAAQDYATSSILATDCLYNKFG
eukprot:jgi/Mesvir1/3764/Mv25083-RA.5